MKIPSKPFVIAKYEIKSVFRNPKALGFMIVLPIVLVGTMAALSTDKTALTYIIAGNMCMVMLFVLAMGTAATLIEKRQTGMLKRLFIMPLRKSIFLAGTTLKGLVEVVVMVGVMIGLLVGFGVEIKGSGFDLGVAILLFALFAIGFGEVISTFASSYQTAIFICMSIILPMSATSGAWMPVKTVEAQLGDYVNINPMYHALKALDAIITKGSALQDVGTNLAVVGITALGLFILSVILYNKIVEA